MDPLGMSQGMYGGLGAQGLGMSGMNVGMGFNTGQGAFGGFNGQPGAWNTGQEKFNQNAYGGLSTGLAGDFGTNAGYGAYNVPPHQGNFNQMHQQFQNHDFQSGYNGQGFYNRGRGRGRGYHNAGRGRGGYNQVTTGNQANYEPFHHQIPQQVAKPDSSQQLNAAEVPNTQEQPAAATEDSRKPSVEQVKPGESASEQLAKELEPGDADAAVETDIKSTLADGSVEENAALQSQPLTTAIENDGQHELKPIPDPKSSHPQDGNRPAPIETYVSSDVDESDASHVPNPAIPPSAAMLPPAQMIPLGPAAYYAGDQAQEYSAKGRGAGRGIFRGGLDYRGGTRARGSAFLSNTGLPQPPSAPSAIADKLGVVKPVEPKGLGVEGAPKAPKALRDGLPNTGMRGGRGFSIIGRASTGPQPRSKTYAKSRRCVQSGRNVHPLIRFLLIILAALRLAHVHALLDAIQVGAGLIVTVPQVVRMTANVTGNEIDTVVTPVSTTLKAITHTTSTQRKQPTNRLTILLKDSRTEATGSMERRGRSEGVAIVPADRIAIEAESGRKIPATAGSDQDPWKTG